MIQEHDTWYDLNYNQEAYVVQKYKVNVRILGFYASGFILIVISLDRVSAILSPLPPRADTRAVAWQSANFKSI